MPKNETPDYPLLEPVDHQPDWWILGKIQWLEQMLEERGVLRPQGPPESANHQEIQLAIIERSSFNEFDGPRVCRDLRRHRKLWTAALIDRDGPSGLIKLRDLDENRWNVDTLHVLAYSEECARKLAEFEEPWRADNVIVRGDRATAEALGFGGYERPERLVSFWWD